MVDHPNSYPGSSYRVTGEGQQSVLLTTPQRLHLDTDARASVGITGNRELFGYQQNPVLIDDIRTATNRNLILGMIALNMKLQQP